MATTKTIDIRTAIPGPRSAEILARKERVIANAKTIVLPIVAQEGRGATLTDVDGNVFIDFTGGVGCLNVGHAHPRVLEAAPPSSSRASRTPTSRSFPTRAVRRARRAAARACAVQRPGQGSLLQRRHGGGRERRQVRAALHQATGGERLRRSLPRPHADGDDAHLAPAPVQGRDGAARARGLSGALPAGLPRPRRQDRARRAPATFVTQVAAEQVAAISSSRSRARAASCRRARSSWRGCARSATSTGSA